MPFRCFDPTAKRDIHAFDLSPKEWQRLESENRKTRDLRMPCCSAQVVLRKSMRGTQFFAHKAVGECSTAPETEAHRRLKWLAVEAARANGWTADTEVTGITAAGEPWRADVLARKGAAKVAIEIQWSRQISEEIIRRQARYAKSGIRCLWLLRHHGFPVDHALPAARIGGNLQDGFVAYVSTGFGEQEVPMRDFLEAAFSRRLRFGVPLGVTANVSVVAGHMFCWSCGAETQIITRVHIVLGSTSAYEFTVPDLTDCRHIVKSVLEAMPKNLSIGVVKHRYSKAQERRYLSNGCFHCGAFIGEFFEDEAWDNQKEVYSFPIRIDRWWIQELLRAKRLRDHLPQENEPDNHDHPASIVGWHVCSDRQSMMQEVVVESVRRDRDDHSC